MKRFILIITTLLIIVIFASAQLFISNNKEDVGYQFTVSGTDIQIETAKGFVEFIPNGVTLTATQPGVIPSGNVVSYETYLEWFALMQEMGLNTIKVEALMPGRFYQAFKAYNESVETPIYLVQGIYFDEVVLKDGYSPMSDKWKKAFEKDIEEAVNAVHGNANFMESIYLYKSDPVDVSEYLLGFVIGVNFGDDDIAYSNAIFDVDAYEGNYFRSGADASNFEKFLTEMLDYTANYEATYYAYQSLYAIHAHGGRLAQSILNGDTITEPYDTVREYPVINAEHITGGVDLKTGFYVNYDIEHTDYELSRYNATDELEAVVNGLEMLVDYHSLPIVISAYGIPTARFASDYTLDRPLPYVDEAIQAKRNVEQYNRLRALGVSGQFLRDWQDAWFKSSWYSYNLKILDHSVLWRDVQTYGQGYGLIAFEPDHAPIHYVDDSIYEWYDIETLVKSNETIYKIDNDAASLHFLINKPDMNEDSVYYIGLDITPNSGSKYVERFDLTFDRPVDFVVLIDRDKRQEIFVQDYYDVNKFRLQRDDIKRHPDEYNPVADSSEFNRIYQYVDTDMLYFKFKTIDDDDIRLTGGLTEGNNNPTADNFNSEADWYSTDSHIELRIPYGLLNFMSPASRVVLDDFNDHHLFRQEHVDGVYVEFAEYTKKEMIYTRAYKYTWDEWTNPAYTMRTKRSYDALKEVMKD